MAVVIAGRQFWLWRAVVPYRFGNNGQEQLERLRGGWRSVPGGVRAILRAAFVKINGKLCYLWRAVDHEGEVLETVVTAKRDKAAALKFLKRIMKKYGRPKSVVTDRLCSYPAAMKEIGNADRHEVGRWLNNPAENSHQPTRRRERKMQRFKSLGSAQRAASAT